MMKLYYRYIYSMLIVMILWIVVSCDNEQYLYDGPNVEPGPTVTIGDPVPALGNSIVEPPIGESVEYIFQINLSKAYETKINVYSEVMEATTATEGADFETSDVLINASSGDTTGVITLTIHGDGEIEETEMVDVVIGNDQTANATIENSKTIQFELINWESPQFEAYTSWAFADGSEDFNGSGPDELLNLLVELYDLTDTSEVANSYNIGFEHLTTPELDDGDYLLTSFTYEIFDPGSFGAKEFNIIQEFEQYGKTVRYEIPIDTLVSTTHEDFLNDGTFNYYDLAVIRVVDGNYSTLSMEDYLAEPGAAINLENIKRTMKNPKVMLSDH